MSTTIGVPQWERGRMRPWLQATGFFRGFLLITFMPAALAAFAVYAETATFSLLRFALMMVGAWLLHMGTNLMNEAEDGRTGVDADNPVKTPFSGGTHVVAEGKLTPDDLQRGSLRAFALGLLLYGACVPLFGWTAFGIAVVGGALGYAYTAPPMRLCYRGLGELTVGLVDGPLMGLVVCYSQLGRFSSGALATSTVMGLLAMAILTMNEFPDIDTDRRHEKRNLVVRLGLARAQWLHVAVSVAGFGVLCAAVAAHLLPAPALLGLLGVVSAAVVFRIPRTSLENIPAMTAACAGTIRTQMVTWVGMCAGFAWTVWGPGGGSV